MLPQTTEYYYDTVSEYMLIGTLIWNEWDKLPEIIELFGTNNPFYEKTNHMVWDRVLSAYSEDNSVQMEKAIGWNNLPSEYKQELNDNNYANIIACAESIKTCFIRRTIRDSLLTIVEKEHLLPIDTTKEIQELATWLEQQITFVDKQRTMIDIANDEMDRLDKIRSGVKVEQWKTYYIPIDEMWGLLDYGFYLIAGEEKAGKSRFAVALMSRIDTAWRLNKIENSQVYFMMEMQDVAVNRMIVANRTGIGTGKLKQGAITNAEYDIVAKAQDEITKSKMIIVDKYSNLDVDELALLVDYYKRKHNAKYFYIDHLLYLTIRGKYFSEREKWSAITQRLKAICKQKQVIMFVLCHLTKGTKDKPTKKDMLTFGTADKDCYGSLGLHRTYAKGSDGLELIDIIGFHSRDGVGGEYEVKADIGKCQFGE